MRGLALKLALRLIRFSLEPALSRKLRLIYLNLDRSLPWFLAKGASPNQIEQIVTNTVTDALRRQPTFVESQLIRLLYDPVLAANVNLKPRR